MIRIPDDLTGWPSTCSEWPLRSKVFQELYDEISLSYATTRTRLRFRSTTGRPEYRRSVTENRWGFSRVVRGGSPLDPLEIL